MQHVRPRISGRILRRALLPVALLALLVCSDVFYHVRFAASVSAEFRENSRHVLNGLLVLSVAFVLQRVSGAAYAWYLEHVASHAPTRLDDELIPLLRSLTTVVIWVLAVLVSLPLFGVNISALITTLGVTSLAVALAAQDVIANFIAGFLIMIDRPFRLGDRIKLPTGETVTVLDIGVRRSQFLAADRSIIIVPNQDLSKGRIVNYTYGDERVAEHPS